MGKPGRGNGKNAGLLLRNFLANVVTSPPHTAHQTLADWG
jgi:hypothetical protein